MENDDNNELKEEWVKSSCSMREIMSKSDKLEVEVGENKRIKLSDVEPHPERVKELQHQNRVLVKERDDMKAERDDLKEGRDAMEAERDAMKEERDAIQQQQNMNIEKKRDSLNEMKEIADAYNGLTSKLREQLECPVCMEVPTSGPLHVCPNGHFVCATCKQEECPTCRIQMSSGKSLLAVTVIENIKHKCKHGDCEKLLYLADYKIHLEACPFNPRKNQPKPRKKAANESPVIDETDDDQDAIDDGDAEYVVKKKSGKGRGRGKRASFPPTTAVCNRFLAGTSQQQEYYRLGGSRGSSSSSTRPDKRGTCPMCDRVMEMRMLLGHAERCQGSSEV